MAVVEHGAPPAPCVPPPRCLHPALPGDILRVLNSEEPAGRAVLLQEEGNHPPDTNRDLGTALIPASDCAISV